MSERTEELERAVNGLLDLIVLYASHRDMPESLRSDILSRPVLRFAELAVSDTSQLGNSK
jgi:hypothetical protein